MEYLDKELFDLLDEYFQVIKRVEELDKRFQEIIHSKIEWSQMKFQEKNLEK